MYDTNNIFAKILNGEIKTDKIYEDNLLIAINDIAPVAPVHILVIPKGQYLDIADFTSKQDSSIIGLFFQKVTEIARERAGDDYRIIANKGAEAGQTIFHFHVHIIGGKKLENQLG